MPGNAKNKDNTPNNPEEETPKGRSDGFLDVFVVRSFQESHLTDVCVSIGNFLKGYSSERLKSKPYRLVDTKIDNASASVIMNEITARIDKAAITIVILDGLRYNVLFELGYLYAARKPIILLKHKQWGPSFIELDLAVSDLKGVIVKDYDHKDEMDFEEILRAEFDRCENKFFEALGTHVIVPQSGDNYVKREWKYESDDKDREDKTQPIVLKSDKYVDLALNKRLSNGSVFYMEFVLPNPNSAVTVYLKMKFCKDGIQKTAWFGYCSKAVVIGVYKPDPRGTSEVTIPLAASGGGTYVIMDDLYAMLKQRLGTIDLGPVIVKRLRLRGKSEAETHVRKILISG